MKTKVCSRGGHRKTIDHFFKDSKSADGYQSQCNECKRDFRATPSRRKMKHIDRKMPHIINEGRSVKNPIYVGRIEKRKRRKVIQESIAGLKIGSIIKLDHKILLIEKVKKEKDGIMVIMKKMNKDGQHIDTRSNPVIIERKDFLYAVKHNGRLPKAA